MKQYSISFFKRVLNYIVTQWFVLAVLGQWIFATYVLFFYGKALAIGHPEDWNKVMPNGYIPKDLFGNLVVGFHLMLAIIVIYGGPLQLIPKFRTYAPKFHRWNGRIYIFLSIIISLSGLIMVWVRGSVGGMVQHISISINAILIIIASFYSYYTAFKRNFSIHRIWAIRLFLLVNGVLFFRVGLFFWLFVNDGPVGFDPKTFQGPFLYFLTFSQYLIPLGSFEIYLIAKKSANKNFMFATSIVIFILTVIMMIGLFAISKDVWFPLM